LVMRWFIVILLGGWLGVGCAGHRQAGAADSPASGKAEVKPQRVKERSREKPVKPLPPGSLSVTNRNTVMTLANPTSGTVVAVNSGLRFAVLDYSLKTIPPLEQRLGIYRQGQKVGEVKISGPEMDGNIVADIVAGEVQAGDEVRLE
jgi:hypothetical protein